MEIGLIREKVYGLLKFSQCTVHVTFFGKRSSKVIIGIRVFGVESYRMFVFCYGIFPKTFFIINSAQIIMNIYLCRIIGKGVLICLYGKVVLHSGLVNVTQIIIRIIVLGV